MLLPQCAGFLNHLMTGIVQDRTNFITGGNEFCADCEQFLSEKEQNNHNPSCQSQIYLTVPSLLSSFQRRTTTDLEPLKRFISTVNTATTPSNHFFCKPTEELKSQLLAVKNTLETMNIPITIDSIGKYFS